MSVDYLFESYPLVFNQISNKNDLLP